MYVSVIYVYYVITLKTSLANWVPHTRRQPPYHHSPPPLMPSVSLEREKSRRWERVVVGRAGWVVVSGSDFLPLHLYTSPTTILFILLYFFYRLLIYFFVSFSQLSSFLHCAPLNITHNFLLKKTVLLESSWNHF